MQRHLHTFAETFPRGSKVLTRVHVVPTVVGGVNPGSTLVQIHFPRLQSAVNSLDAKWNTSMSCQNFGGEPDIAYNAVQDLVQDIVTGRQALVTGHVSLIHYNCYSVVRVYSDI